MNTDLYGLAKLLKALVDELNKAIFEEHQAGFDKVLGSLSLQHFVVRALIPLRKSTMETFYLLTTSPEIKRATL